MFNKKILLRFYLIGLPIIMIWAYIVTSPSIEDPYEEDSPIHVTTMNAEAFEKYKEIKAAYIEEVTRESRSMFWPLVGAGIVWIGMAYVIFSIALKVIKAKK